MPDWFYRTISRPLLFQLPPGTSRTLATTIMGAVSRLPQKLGNHVIEFLGHMQPPPSLQSPLLGTQITTPIGLGCHLDPNSTAILAWQNFGFGFLEIGPIGASSPDSPHTLIRHVDSQQLECSLPISCTPHTLLLSKLSKWKAQLKLPLTLRWMIHPSETPQSAAQSFQQFLSQLPLAALPSIRAITVDRLHHGREPEWSLPEWREFWNLILPPHHASAPTPLPRLQWLCTPQNTPALFPLIQNLITQQQLSALHIESRSLTPHSVLFGNLDLETLLALLRELRSKLPKTCDVLVSGGIHQPQTARLLLDAGASAVLIDTGLIFSGPGLPKRVNQGLLSCKTPSGASALAIASPPEPPPVFKQSWFWTLMLGVGMLIGGVMALAMATGPVVMPYDEAFCGLTARQLSALNPKLLAFMSHDRVTLAGAMLSIGLLYTCYSWFGVRSGLHGLRTSILLSAGIGFVTFFLFLGFDYFDPFHAFVTAILFQLFVQALVTHDPLKQDCPQPDWIETAAWRKAQWGQLLWIIHACGLLIAGMIIAWIGSTDVLVATDQAFLEATPTQFRAQNARILPLIAHDRATLGGMLIAAGIPFLLTTLWTVRRGERWLWYTLLAAALIAYVPAIGIHFAIGYVHTLHLLPAFAGLTLFIVGAALLHPWMTSRHDPEQHRE